MCRALLEICCICFGADDTEVSSSEETCPLIGEYNKPVDDVVEDQSSATEITSGSVIDEEDDEIHSLECSTASLSSLEEEINSPDGFLVLDLTELDHIT